ncbi:MAG TPA: hypothetical protein V6D10_00855 [Trichocoleus sp.]
MPEPISALIGIAGLIGVAFAFSSMNLVKDLGRTIALALLVILVVLMSDRILPQLRGIGFSLDRLPDFSNFRLPNLFANERTPTGLPNLPDGVSAPSPVQRIPPSSPIVPAPSPLPAPSPTPAIEPFEAGGVVPSPVPILPPRSNPQPGPSPAANSVPTQRPIAAWW